MSSIRLDDFGSLLTKLSMNGTLIAPIKPTTLSLIARLNIAPMPFSARKANLLITPKASKGIVRSAIVRNSIFAMKISSATMKRQ